MGTIFRSLVSEIEASKTKIESVAPTLTPVPPAMVIVLARKLVEEISKAEIDDGLMIQLRIVK